MNRIALALAFSLALQPVAALADVSSSPASAISTSAPADEYFGAYGMSVLGMRNALRDLTRAADDGADHARIFAKLVSVEQAMAEWRTRYPADAWLPREGLRMAQLFARLHTQAAADHARVICEWIMAGWPDSDEAAMASSVGHVGDDLADPNVPIATQNIEPSATPAPTAPTAPIASPAVADVAPVVAPAHIVTRDPAIVAVPIIVGAAILARAMLRRHH